MNKNFRKILSLLLSAVLVFALGTIGVSASGLTGNGSQNDPYKITSAADLDLFSEAVANGDNFSGKYVLLTNDIEVNEDFAPIGTQETPFAGIFDGNNRTVSGLKVNLQNYAGFFAHTKNADITNLTVEGEFNATDFAGSIVAYAENTDIENCTNNASVYADNYAGGIAGYISSGSIVNCSSSFIVFIFGYEEFTGGIAGYTGADIDNCTNSTYIYAAKNVGGIAGFSTADITNCVNDVTIEATLNNCGGIAGYASGAVKYCKNTGTVSGAGKTGGIVGMGSSAQIAECSQQGAVSSSGEYAGGIAGYLTGGSVSDCICTATVNAKSDFAAGIFGSASSTEVTRCLFTSTASASNSTDAAIGAIASGKVTACYFDKANESKAFVSGTSTDGAAGLTASEISQVASYEGWDFDNIWAMNEIHSSSPLLRSIGFHSLSVASDVKATCTEDGHRTEICSICHETIETTFVATGHDYKMVSIKHTSCIAPGYTDYVCTVCGDAKTETIDALPHTDADNNEVCDTCGQSLNENPDEEVDDRTFFEKLIDFFESIINWLKNLFK